jgi:hypothetical protein
MISGRRSRPREESVDPCVVPGCGAPSVRSLALAEAKRAFNSLPDSGRRAPLCRAHYKEWKKSTREERALDRLGW